MLVIKIKNLATCFGSMNHSLGRLLKTQYWYIQRVRTLWDPIPFTDHFAFNLMNPASYI